MNIQPALLSRGFGRGRFTPVQGIVIHYTADDAECSPAYWESLAAKNVSTHFVVDQDGSVHQLVRVEDRAWHAGRSQWLGLGDCNQFMLGVDLVNFGWGQTAVQGKVRRIWRNAQGQQCGATSAELECPAGDCPDHRANLRGYHWESYPAVQVAAATELVILLLGQLKLAPENVVGHEHVSPTQKQDPGPAARRFWRGLPTTSNVRGSTKALQSHLQRLGLLQGAVDGSWGPLTQAAVERAWATYAPLYQLPAPPTDRSPDEARRGALALRLIPGFPLP